MPGVWKGENPPLARETTGPPFYLALPHQMRWDHRKVWTPALLLVGDLLTQSHQRSTEVLPGFVLFLTDRTGVFHPVFDQAEASTGTDFE